jgi:hypothetical protein
MWDTWYGGEFSPTISVPLSNVIPPTAPHSLNTLLSTTVNNDSVVIRYKQLENKEIYGKTCTVVSMERLTLQQ